MRRHPNPTQSPASAWSGWTRIDAHCHSNASEGPVLRVVGAIGIPECYSEPEAVYDQAKARGMDLVTITDHDTIAGALSLTERGFEGFIIGEEVTVFFPEDRCKLHVTVWDLTPELHEEIATLGLRDDVYQFCAWLKERNLPHALAHPVYVQNGKLSISHLERCCLLFRGFEVLNGAHSGTHRLGIERLLQWLDPERIRALSIKHNLLPIFDEPWIKGRTGGSDDHGLLNIGRTFTAINARNDAFIREPRSFFDLVMQGRSQPGGNAGHASLLAHQLTTVASHYTSRHLAADMDPGQRYLASKLLRFAGVPSKKPSKLSLALHMTKRKLLLGKRQSLPITTALRDTIGPVLEAYPDLRERFDPARWSEGSALSQHERMADFADDLSTALSRAMASGALDSIRKHDKLGIVDHLISYSILLAAQTPYIFSLFYQNKDRNLVEQLNHNLAEPGSGASALERPMKVSLFTDTLGDVNGVCRFIQNAAQYANENDRDLDVITSTTFEVPEWDNIHNFEPSFAMDIPKYENLQFVLPPVMKILRHVDRHQPDVIHISTPGPVGLVGYIAAKMLRVPVLGVYHTDFPAYVDHLFEDHGFTWATRKYMQWFYKPFWSIFTRSDDYIESLVELGIERERCSSLTPGVDTNLFSTEHRDPDFLPSLGDEGSVCGHHSTTETVRVLFVGRLSVEKNLPMLAKVWKRVDAECRKRGLDAELLLVGDGPYREQMIKELKKTRTRFLGFRHGSELSTIYASCDIFAFPSTTDTLGQVVMEAQASGEVVLVTDRGGPQEVVRHGETGFVLSATDTDRWVRTLVELIENGARRRTMAEAAHAAMQEMTLTTSFEHFWQAHVDAWHRHLAQLGIESIEGGSISSSIGQTS
ncbi:MAG TPA: glycosyltransferase [Phycisphaerales bacterium]|nr:glycosyltransferase [Phycisphaerales bacterium]